MCFACLRCKEFRLAKVCGLQIACNTDEFETLILYYQNHFFFDELISLLESTTAMDYGNMGLFTKLAVFYSIYKPEKMLAHLKAFLSQIDIPSVIFTTKMTG